ncbi:unnamed protein product [Caenorhabditis auriculariae]|uniref:7TM GPCR serpentine receptor class x (Srx) domain-containing protein n=1 Tax=Caenorhabditis auriculariae TaxID=2777116 RepID=A0A8S1H4E3_9PELO|nr:unnamed protein product [Caenorhabditis auriculariae]
MNPGGQRTALDFIAPALLFIDGVIGIAANGALLVLLSKETMTSFSVVCWVRAFVNLVILLLVFVIDNAPAAFLGKSLLPEIVETFIYAVALLVYMINQVTSLFIAVNRCTSVFFPMHFEKVFRVSVTVDGIIGIAANGALLVLLSKETMTSFSVVCWVRAFVNLVILLLVFVIDNAPAAFLGKSLLPEIVETFIYAVALLVYMINQVTSLFIAVNRCTSVFFPMHFEKVFRVSVTVNLETMLSQGITVGAILFVINVITFGKIIHFHYTNSIDDQISNKRIRRNILLWFQTILQDFLFTTDFVFTAIFGFLLLVFIF